MNWRCHKQEIETNHRRVVHAQSRQMALEVKRKVMEEMMNGKEVEEVNWKDKCFRCDS